MEAALRQLEGRKDTYDIYIYEVNSKTKYEFYIFIETLQIVSCMCSPDVYIYILIAIL